VEGTHSIPQGEIDERELVGGRLGRQPCDCGSARHIVVKAVAAMVEDHAGTNQNQPFESMRFGEAAFTASLFYCQPTHFP